MIIGFVPSDGVRVGLVCTQRRAAKRRFAHDFVRSTASVGCRKKLGFAVGARQPHNWSFSAVERCAAAPRHAAYEWQIISSWRPRTGPSPAAHSLACRAFTGISGAEGPVTLRTLL